ncbi:MULTISPECIES: hypothetical protein [unclassified Psychrobacter]|uniref:hypothetical protein n=1 Tax=unclassified Psychrobacter TaxID=196806 RepID=UPI003FB8236C
MTKLLVWCCIYILLIVICLTTNTWAAIDIFIDPNTKSPILAQLCLSKESSDNQSLNNE